MANPRKKKFGLPKTPRVGDLSPPYTAMPPTASPASDNIVPQPSKTPSDDAGRPKDPEPAPRHLTPEKDPSGDEFDAEEEGSDEASSLVAQVASIYVPHTRFVDTMTKIRTALDTLHGIDEEPACLYVTGPSGVGKSTLLRKLAEDYPKETDGVEVSHPLLGSLVADCIPLPVVKMPSKPTVISIGQAILKALGDPNWFRGASRSSIEARVDLLLLSCRSKGIVFDEAQRIVDRGGTVVSFDIVDWLRDRSANNGVILVLVGLGRLAAAFLQDDQFLRRYDAEIRLLPYTWKNEIGVDLREEQEDFRAVLIALKDVMPLPFASDIDVDHPDEFTAMVAQRRFYYASNGLLGRLLKLFKHAMRHVSSDPEKHRQLTLDLLSTAFEAAFDHAKAGMANPFAVDWVPCLPPTLTDDRQLIFQPRRKRRAGLKATQAERQRDIISKLSKKR